MGKLDSGKVLLSAAAGNLTGRVINEGLERKKKDLNLEKKEINIGGNINYDLLTDITKRVEAFYGKDPQFDLLVSRLKNLLGKHKDIFSDENIIINELMPELEEIKNTLGNRIDINALRKNSIIESIEKLEEYLSKKGIPKEKALKELGNFKSKVESVVEQGVKGDAKKIMEYVFNDPKIRDLIINGNYATSPFYIDGSTITLNVDVQGIAPYYYPEKKDNYNRKHLSSVVLELNTYLNRLIELVKLSGSTEDIGMLFDLAHDTKKDKTNAEKYKLEIEGTPVKEFLDKLT